jgi:hypothetical protein
VYDVSGKEVERLLERLVFGTRLLTMAELTGTEYVGRSDMRVVATIDGLKVLSGGDVLIPVWNESVIEDCLEYEKGIGDINIFPEIP